MRGCGSSCLVGACTLDLEGQGRPVQDYASVSCAADQVTRGASFVNCCVRSVLRGPSTLLWAARAPRGSQSRVGDKGRASRGGGCGCIYGPFVDAWMRSCRQSAFASRLVPVAQGCRCLSVLHVSCRHLFRNLRSQILRSCFPSSHIWSLSPVQPTHRRYVI